MELSPPSIQDILLKTLQDFMTSNLLMIVLFFLAIIIIFLLIRELLTWYWKIDKIVNILERIEIGVDFLATNVDQNNKIEEEDETVFIEKPVEETKAQDPNK